MLPDSQRRFEVGKPSPTGGPFKPAFGLSGAVLRTKPSRRSFAVSCHPFPLDPPIRCKCRIAGPSTPQIVALRSVPVGMTELRRNGTPPLKPKPNLSGPPSIGEVILERIIRPSSRVTRVYTKRITRRGALFPSQMPAGIPRCIRRRLPREWNIGSTRRCGR